LPTTPVREEDVRASFAVSYEPWEGIAGHHHDRLCADYDLLDAREETLLLQGPPFVLARCINGVAAGSATTNEEV
jgi:hypothetical protein